MTLQSVIEAALVFSFLVIFAIDDLQTRRIDNKKTAKFLIVALVLLISRYSSLDRTWATETTLCLTAMLIMYRPLRIFGGADFKIISILSLLYGPAAVFYALVSILAGGVWQKTVVHDGYDRFLKMDWDGVPVMFFYLFVFTLFEIVISSIRQVQLL